MSFETQFHRLEQMVRQLKIDYERFFNGALEIPPETLKTQIQQGLRQLQGDGKGTAESFRLAGLEARFNSLCELSGRRLRIQEEGRGPQQRERPAAEARLDPRRGVLIGERAETPVVEALYNELYQASGTTPRFDLDSFRVYLDRQAAAIRAKTGAEQIQFRIADDDGKPKLKVKPIRS